MSIELRIPLCGNRSAPPCWVSRHIQTSIVMAKRIACLLILLLSGCSRRDGIPHGDATPYAVILHDLLDIDRIADLSQPGSMLFSSWDRTGGNDDFGNFLGDGPKGWKILADFTGPGYISRSWFTGAKDGSKRIRFLIDDARTPLHETSLDDWCGPWNDFSDLPFRGYEPYCWFSWRPVTFSRRLIVMHQEPVDDEKIYYQINVNRLPDGQRAEVWHPRMMQDPELTAIEQEINDTWLRLQRTDTTEIPSSQLVPAHEETTVWEQAGAGTIQSIRIAPRWPDEFSVRDREDALRAMVVRLYWDNHPEPSVDVPLGALFGSMWHEMQYGSIYFGMSSDVYRISFPMPFREHARLSVLNQGQTPFDLGVAVESDASLPADTFGYFHAGWRKSLASQVGTPHTILRTQGRGKYVGCILGVIDLNNSWWSLESDEHIYVDGEVNASWRGTGLEDYFNGGWYYGNALASPLHGIPFKAQYRTVQHRLHLTDPVAFQSSLNMIFERGPKNVSNAEMESVSFYYLDQPARADSDLRDPDFRTPVTDPAREYTLMVEVNNFERMGDISGAISRIRSYLADFPDTPHRDILESRIERYDDPHTIPEGKAVLGVYANTHVRVFLNGQLVEDMNDPRAERVRFQTLDLPSGTHTLAIQYARFRYPDWVQLSLEYPGGFIGTDNTWKFAFDPTGRWTSPDFDDSTWPPQGHIWTKGPPEAPYLWIEPHDRVFTQSRAWGLRAPRDWPPNGRFMVLRKTFTIP